MRKQKTKADIDRYWKKVYANKARKKAAEINKILSRKDVLGIVNDGNRYQVTFKNGQVFKFVIWFPALFSDRKICYLEE